MPLKIGEGLVANSLNMAISELRPEMAKKYEKSKEPCKDALAFAKAFNQICTDSPLTENTWEIFKMRDFGKDKQFLTKKVDQNKKSPKDVLKAVVSFLGGISVETAVKACPEIMPIQRCVVAWLDF